MRKLLKFLILLAILFAAFRVFAFFSDSKEKIDFNNKPKKIHINDNGFQSEIISEKNALKDLLEENRIKIGNHDKISPNPESKIFPGMNIEIRRAMEIKIEVDGKTIENHTLERNIEKIIAENNLILGKLDKVSPGTEKSLQKNETIIITRINVEEVIKKEEIDFKTTTKNDSELGWREKKITTQGEKGIKEVKYRITYKNGKEISRIKLSQEIIKDPVTQVETQGTYMKLGKANKGLGTWYAWKGGMFAASTTIPKGAYVKVTATASGKTIVVQINDYGPQGKGRIIDLDKVAFEKLAPLGAGVIGVKVEQILN